MLTGMIPLLWLPLEIVGGAAALVAQIRAGA